MTTRTPRRAAPTVVEPRVILDPEFARECERAWRDAQDDWQQNETTTPIRRPR